MKMVEFFLNYQNKDLKTIQEENFEENCHKIQLMSNFQFFLKFKEENIVNILKNIVVNSAIMYDLKEKNLIFPLFQIIGQLDYPEENVDIKREYGFIC
jgi:hypothetical protein